MTLNRSGTFDDENTTTMSEATGGRENNEARPPAAEVEEPWEAVDETGNAAGVLIVPPEDDALLSPRNIVDAVPQPPVAGEAASRSYVIESDHLSFPESLPSDIGSVHSADGLVDDNDRMNQQRGSRDGNSFQLPGAFAIPRGHLRFALEAVVVVLLLLVSNAMIRSRDTEILVLKRDLMELNKTFQRLSESRSSQEASAGPPPGCVCNCGASGGGSFAAMTGDGAATAIVDNCWLNVHAGECADNAINKVQETFFSFQKTVQKGFRSMSESWATIQRKDGEAPSAGSTEKTEVGVGVSFQGFRAAVDMIVPGVAALALARVVEELVSHILEPGVEDPDD